MIGNDDVNILLKNIDFFKGSLLVGNLAIYPRKETIYTKFTI